MYVTREFEKFRLLCQFDQFVFFFILNKMLHYFAARNEALPF